MVKFLYGRQLKIFTEVRSWGMSFFCHQSDCVKEAVTKTCFVGENTARCAVSQTAC